MLCTFQNKRIKYLSILTGTEPYVRINYAVIYMLPACQHFTALEDKSKQTPRKLHSMH